MATFDRRRGTRSECETKLIGDTTGTQTTKTRASRKQIHILECSETYRRKPSIEKKGRNRTSRRGRNSG